MIETAETRLASAGPQGQDEDSRGRVLKRVYRPVAGDVAACLLVDGRVVGTWSWKRTKRRLVVSAKPFRKLGRSVTAEAGYVVRELGAIVGAGG